MTSRPSDTQDRPIEPKTDATEASEATLSDEALDEVVASGVYPLPRGNPNTGPGG